MATPNRICGQAAPACCPCCHSRQAFTCVEAVGRYSLWLCEGCDVIFCEPMEAGTADWYEALYVVRQRAVDMRKRSNFRWALERLPPEGSLLDIGCGTGFFVHCARRRGLEAYGVDFAPATIEAGRQRFRTDALYAGSPDAMPEALSERRFDVVTSFEVLEHQSDPQAFMRSVRGILKPGGRILLSVPNRDRSPVREFVDYPPHHLLWWSAPALERFLRREGFEVLALEGTSRLQSMNYFFGYFAKALFYRALGLRLKAFREARKGPTPPTGFLRKYPLGGLICMLRRVRDAVMWIPTFVTWPWLRHKIKGYHLMAEARLRE